MLRDQKTRRKTGAAAHEAGHAVVAFDLGFRIDSVRIFPSAEGEGGWEGQVDSEIPEGTDSRLRAAYFLAGAAAEDLFDGTLDDGRQGYIGAFPDILCAHYSMGWFPEEPESVEDFAEPVKALREAYDVARQTLIRRYALWQEATEVLVRDSVIPSSFWEREEKEAT